MNRAGPDRAGSIPLVDLARSVIRWRRIESSTAAVLGGLIPTIDPPRLRAVLAGWAAHHAWHAELWTQRYPVIEGWAPPDDLSSAETHGIGRPSAPQLTELVHWLIETVWTPLITDLEQMADAIDIRLDAPTHRVIELVLGDLRRDLLEAQALPSGR